MSYSFITSLTALVILYDEVMRVAFLADGDVAHGRVGTDGARPADGDDIVVFLAVAAGDHHGGQGINQCAGFEGDFHIVIFCFYECRAVTMWQPYFI